MKSNRFNLEKQTSWLKKLLTPVTRLPLLTGAGDDDCAHFSIGKTTVSVTSDFINANPLVTRLKLGGPRELGRLISASNISDLLGSGSCPKYLLINICLPRSWGRKEFIEIMYGANEVAKLCDVQIIGGDSKYGSVFSGCGTAIGLSEKKGSILLKNMARPNQDVWLSSPVGSCTAAVIACSSRGQKKKYLKWIKRIIGHPILPISQARATRELLLNSGGVDISDGLSSDVIEMCRSSKVGISIDGSAIPMDRTALKIASFFNIDPIRLALGIGGDFSFAVTADKRYRERLRKAGLYKIGTTTQANKFIISDNGKLRPLEAAGHNDAFFDDIVSEALDICGVAQ